MKLRFHRTLLYFIIIIQLTSLYCYGTTDTFAPANKILDAESVITQSTASSGADSGRWPNDFYSSVFNDNENANIALPTAWLLQTVSSVKVGITDTGIYANHEDFAGNYMGGASFISNEPNYGVDPNGHGTKIAGIFGAVGNNEIGVNGVCWYSHIKSLKVLDNTGNGDPYDLIAAINTGGRFSCVVQSHDRTVPPCHGTIPI